MDEAEKRRRAIPAGLVANGCTRHCLEDVRRGVNWAAEKSPRHLADALQRGMRETNAPLGSADPWNLSFMTSLRLWEALIERGWDINQRSTQQPSSQRFRLIDFVCDRENLFEWLLDHGATLDDGEKDDWKCPPLLQSVAERGFVSQYKRLQELGAPHGPRELHLAVETSCYREHMNMLRFLVDEIGWDVNQLDEDTNMSHGPPLWWAIQNSKGGEKAVRFLLERGADPSVNGMDLFKDAEERGNQGVLEVLQEWKDGKIPVQKKDSSSDQ
ncbi:unnamed protein product [Penicillium pancosmium]